jgi:hypothetical protein
LVLRNIDYNQMIDPASKSTLKLEWENLGIATPFRDHRVAFHLRDSRDSIQGEYISDQSIRGWLPGSTSVEIEYPFPPELSKREYTLELGLVFHSAPDHIVPIANEGKTGDGWYVVGTIRIRA